MNARLIAAFGLLTLTGVARAEAPSQDSETELAYKQPGYVMEVVVVTAPRPAATRSEPEDVVLAREQPGYVEEVVIVRASRSEVLEAAGWPDRPMRVMRPGFFGLPAQ
jgi:hypothetical protein